MLNTPSSRILQEYPSLIYAARGGEMKILAMDLKPRTASEVVKLGLMFLAFLTGVLTMGVLM